MSKKRQREESKEDFHEDFQDRKKTKRNNNNNNGMKENDKSTNVRKRPRDHVEMGSDYEAIQGHAKRTRFENGLEDSFSSFTMVDEVKDDKTINCDITNDALKRMHFERKQRKESMMHKGDSSAFVTQTTFLIHTLNEEDYNKGLPSQLYHYFN